MALMSWKNNADGNWAAAANWSTGVVPGPSDDVTISTANLHTITYSAGTDSVLSLYTDNDILSVTGGTLTVLGNATIYGAVDQSAGTLGFAGLNSEITGVLTQTAGTINVASGNLELTGTGNSIGGTLSGSGVSFAAGTDTLAATLTLKMGQVLIDGATVTLGKSFSEAGIWTQTSGILSLGGFTLTETGTTNLDGGTVNGAGTLAVSNAEIGGFSLEGSAVLNDTGSITQTGSWYLGYNSSDTAKLTIQAVASFTIADNANINGSASAALSNAGKLIKQSSGNSVIDVSTTNTGAITIGSGVLTFDGTSNSFGGSISGSGELELSSGTDKFNTGLSLTVSHMLLDGSAGLTLTANQSYVGIWTQTSGILSLGGFTLTETGTTNLDGGTVNGAGTLAVSNAEIGGFSLEGSAVLNDTGSITQTGSWYLGYNSSDTAKLTIQAAASFTIADNANINGSASAALSNAGKLIKQSSGNSVIDVSTTNTGAITIGSGVLTFDGTSNSFGGSISGSGELELSSGTDKFNTGLSLTVSHMLLDGSAGLTLTANQSYVGIWTQTSGILSLGGFTLTETGTTNLDGGTVNGAGTLAVSNAEIGGFSLEGSAVLNDTGSITQTGSWYLGYNSSDTAKLTIQAAASFTIADNANINGSASAALSNAGKLIKQSSGNSVIDVSTTNTGAITIGSGVLTFDGTSNSFGGSISGSGELELSSGTDKFNTGLSLTVSHMLLDGSAGLTLTANQSYVGIWTQTSGILSLGGFTLTETGTTNLDGGTVNGAGTLAVSNAEIGGFSLEGSAVLNDTGSITQTGSWYLGYNSSDTAKLTIQAAASFTIADNANINGSASAALSNAGKLIKQSSGNSVIDVSTTNTGAITIGSGVLTFDGTSNSFGGSISGSGELELSSGTDKFNTGLSLTVSHMLLDGSAGLTLTANQSYVGIWTQTSGILSLGGFTLTETGTTNLDGGTVNGAGTLAVSNAEIGGFSLEGSAVLNDTGSITQTGSWYLGYNSSDTAKLTIQAAASFTIADNANINGSASAALSNAGKLIKQSGDGISTVGVATINTGSIQVGSGTLSFLSTVSGDGSFVADASTTLKFGAAVSGGGEVTLDNFSDLFVAAAAGFHDTIAGSQPAM